MVYVLYFIVHTYYSYLESTYVPTLYSREVQQLLRRNMPKLYGTLLKLNTFSISLYVYIMWSVQSCFLET